jgi:hypothetical protein
MKKMMRVCKRSKCVRPGQNCFDKTVPQTFYLVKVILGEIMLNQTTATIIASSIAVIGTLGGAITGVLLSNNHTSKMEKLRIEQEKAKLNVAVVEEVYTLLTKIENQIFKKVGKMKAPETHSEEMDRVKTLIYLYLPSQKQKFDELSESILNLAFALSDVEGYDGQEKLQCFRKCLNDLQSSIEMMVK